MVAVGLGIPAETFRLAGQYGFVHFLHHLLIFIELSS